VLLGNGEIIEKKPGVIEFKGAGYYLTFINMAMIERYLQVMGALRS
jgi:hypothetical protein